MRTDTSQKIVGYITDKQQVTAKELIDYLLLSPQAVFKQLKKLIEQKKIKKIGTPPKVFYSLLQPLVSSEIFTTVHPKIASFINEHFLVISPVGEMKQGLTGFQYWCEQRQENFVKMATDYFALHKKYNALKKNNLIDGIAKMKNTFGVVNLDEVYYLDFYSIERFGKTKLGQMLLYAKQSQNRQFIAFLIDDIQPKIQQLIKKFRIDAIGFVPATIKREVQFMKELEKKLNLPVPAITITKLKTPIVVPQKTLNKLNDRIENAKQTFVIESNVPYKNILLIDDAVGSGATLNEVAGQIRMKGLCSGKIIGLAITGSLKGFDVISEV